VSGRGTLLVAATELELCGQPGLVCGVGPVEAAAATARALADQLPQVVLHVGIAGAHEIDPPALVIGSEALYEDLGTELAPSRAAPDPALVEVARVAVPEALVVPIGTTARVGGSSGAQVEAMEGFAVLRACELAGVPAVEVRAVSNRVSDPRDDWRVDDAVEALAHAVRRLLAALAE
jgi:nucleoside phosphorylase